MTSRERFIAALERRPLTGLVPHFELVFYLTMEAFGAVHPTHRVFRQWNQMSAREQDLQVRDVARVYVETARRYGHSAIHVQEDPANFEWTSRVLAAIRELSGDTYFLGLHGDPTFAIPDGDGMLAFSEALYSGCTETQSLAKSASSRNPFALVAFRWCTSSCMATAAYAPPTASMPMWISPVAGS